MRVLAIALALGAALTLGAPTAAAQAGTLTVGVFLPHATFADNASRSRYADKLAAAIAAEIGPGATVEARAFGRRADARAFLQAGKIDLLVCDGLFAAGQSGRVVAHGVTKAGEVGPAPTLYASGGTSSALDLRGATIAIASDSDQDLRFFVNTALEGEVDPGSFFGNLVRTKDTHAALAAVRAGKARAAFAPKGHPAASGLTAVASRGQLPIAVVVARSSVPEDVDGAVRAALKKGAGNGGGIAGWSAGSGGLGAAKSAARRPAKVTSEGPQLAPASADRIALPRIRVTPRGQLPDVSVAGLAVLPSLPPEDEP